MDKGTPNRPSRRTLFYFISAFSGKKGLTCSALQGLSLMGSPAHGESGARAAAADARGTRGGILHRAPLHSHHPARLRTCALLTIRGLASFLALFVVTQYSAKLGLRAGFLLEAVFVAAMAALLFVLLRNRPADKGLPLSPAAW